MRRVDLEVYRLPVDALIVACYSRRLVLNLALHVGKVVETLTGNVEEFSPLLLASDACRRMGHMDLVIVVFVTFAWEVDELQNERSACDNAAATGEEIFADNVLEHG